MVCVGPATKLVPWVHDHLKGYEATFQLGKRSDTDDTDGQVEPVPVPKIPTREEIESALTAFVGHIQQVPPAYSALKVEGRRAYALARAGETVELAAREIYVQRITVLEYEFPTLKLSIDCGTGTYIRSIGRDLARSFGTEAVMSALVRTYVGNCTLPLAVNLDSLTRENLQEQILSPLTLLNHLPHVIVSSEEAQRLVWGQKLPFPQSLEQAPESDIVIQHPFGQLFAIGRKKEGLLAPQNVFGVQYSASG